MIQRAIDAQAFARLDHSLVNTPPIPNAKLTGPGAAIFILKRDAAGTGFEIKPAGAGGAWAPITINLLTTQYSWPGETVAYGLGPRFASERNLEQRQLKQRGADHRVQQGTGQPGALTIDEFHGDPLALVHHTSGGGSPDHLTVENAHISIMHQLKEMRSLTGFDKGSMDKPAHEAFMAAYESAKVDNLNFFPAAGLDYSLEQHLRVMRHAIDLIPGVPPIHGVEVVRSAMAMATAHQMNPAQMYLPVDKGMERHLFRAALNMTKLGLLAVPAPIVTAFAGFDAQPKPMLTNAAQTTLKEGEQGYNELERSLIAANLNGLLGYLNSIA